MSDYDCFFCAPPVLYSTTKIYLESEAALAQFCGPFSAIPYSFGAETASSTIPAFVTRIDLYVVDDSITYPLLVGAYLSHARAIPFNHNDMTDLRRVLQEIMALNLILWYNSKEG